METDDRGSAERPEWHSATGAWLTNRLRGIDADAYASPQRMSPQDVQSLERVAKRGSSNIYFNAALENRFIIEQRINNRLPRLVICAMAVLFYGTAPLWVGWLFNLPAETEALASRFCLWLIAPFHVIAGVAQLLWVSAEFAEGLLLVGFCMQTIFIEFIRVHAATQGVHLGPMLTASTPICAFSMVNLSLRRRVILLIMFFTTLLVSYMMYKNPQALLSNGEWIGAALVVTLSMNGSIFFQVSVRRGWAANNLLEVSAAQDVLTGLPNRYAFLSHVETYLRSAQRYDKICMLALVDLDHFKKINDHYGHEYGDGVLMEIGLCLEQFSRRAGDIVARIGGEEFAIFLYDCPWDGAKRRLDDLTDAICDLGIDHEDNDGRIVTASIGAVMMSPNASLSAAYQEADKRLYKAKEMGRNRIVFTSHIV